MMLATLSLVAKALFAFSLILFFISAYQQTKLIWEWSDENPQLDWLTRNFLSTQVIFFASLSEKGRRRRRILAMTTVGFVVFGLASVVLQRFADGRALFE
ncbi:hypothetical protein [Bradyrhizobium sp. SYSU BS000235]|uniref:hypothetical protein n=1 Tax=Bradyrhizobium sp. SYSU BS000235 TaxID=3411332 RepID=UPI003C75C63E